MYVCMYIYIYCIRFAMPAGLKSEIVFRNWKWGTENRKILFKIVPNLIPNQWIWVQKSVDLGPKRDRKETKCTKFPKLTPRCPKLDP